MCSGGASSLGSRNLGGEKSWRLCLQVDALLRQSGVPIRSQEWIETRSPHVNQVVKRACQLAPIPIHQHWRGSEFNYTPSKKFKLAMLGLFSQHARPHAVLPVMGFSRGLATGPRTPPCPALQRRCVHRRPLPTRRSGTTSAPGAASAAFAEPVTEQQQAFQELLQQAASLSTASSTSSAPAAAVTLQPCEHGSGLFLTHDVAPGDVVLRVPASLCLMVDYSQGLKLPQAEWPRVRRQLARDDATPWDLLLVRCTLLAFRV